MIILSQKENCCGCSACESICAHDAIQMIKDDKGFFYPSIDKKKCIDCHRCEYVCPLRHTIPENKSSQLVFAAVNKNRQILLDSSSGGAFYQIAKYVIDKNGVVFGAANEGIVIKHKAAATEDKLRAIMRSKYVQSDTRDCYKSVLKYLNGGIYVLFSGTPCQVAALKRFLKKDYENLITLDIFCHGVPSPGLWEDYMLNRFPQLTSSICVERIAFRNTENGLGFRIDIEYIDSEFNKVVIKDECDDNSFYQLFLSHVYRPSCYSCKFRNIRSYADFTIGDCWNADVDHPQMNSVNGISTIIVHTDKAYNIFEKVKDNFQLEVEEIEVIIARYKQYSKESIIASSSLSRKFLDHTICFKYLDLSIYIFKGLMKIKKIIWKRKS